MNHPFPANIPLIRSIYEGRFSAIRFLIPFERVADSDVITVYRGSYNHAAYLTDAYHALGAIDCDYYIVVHDDVLLNPKLSEDSFSAYFPIGPDDGFLPHVEPTSPEPGRNAWVFGMTARQLFPTSMLFGSGIERQTLARYLPSPQSLREGFAKASVSGTEKANFASSRHIGAETMGAVPSRLVLHGLTPWLPSGYVQDQVERASSDAARSLSRAMLDANSTGRSVEADALEEIEMPIPTVTSNYFTDFYVVPKKGFAEFCHFSGVAGAANLFVEITAPTLLFACCERVWTAPELFLDFSGFDRNRPLQYFEDDRNFAIHPFKLSSFRREEKGDALISALTAIARGGPSPRDNILVNAGFGRGQTGFVGLAEGWHPQEGWGLWSSARSVEIPVVKSEPGPVTITLHPPGGTEMRGRLVLPGGEVIELAPPRDRGNFPVYIDRLDAGESGRATIRLENDALYRLCDLDPDGTDTREIGFGLVRLEGVDL